MSKRSEVALYQKKVKPEIHPVWRGIGCLFMIIVPIMAYALASLLVPVVQATGRLPYQLFQRLHFPLWVYKTPVLSSVGYFLGSIDDFWALVMLFIISLILFSFLASLVYTTVYQSIGPKRYTPLDAPPSRHKAKQYKR
jgi:hypothetical protein